MQRCVAKSNSEMAYQLHLQQEQLVSYGGYNMFFRFVPYTIMRCRQHAVESAALRAPHLRVMPLEPAEGGEADALPIQEVADLEDDDAGRPPCEPRRQSQVVSHNQKDDYVHRGSSAVLACMSLVNYSRFVRRVARSRAGRADYVRYFPFEEHYAHCSSSLQARWEVLAKRNGENLELWGSGLSRK